MSCHCFPTRMNHAFFLLSLLCQPRVRAPGMCTPSSYSVPTAVHLINFRLKYRKRAGCIYTGHKIGGENHHTGFEKILTGWKMGVN